jgi:hypothetical protein
MFDGTAGLAATRSGAGSAGSDLIRAKVITFDGKSRGDGRGASAPAGK